MEAPLSPLSSRACPDSLKAALERPACAVFCKENRMKIAASPTPTGNPGQPRDLQFYRPFLGMFFDRAYPDFLSRCTEENRGWAFRKEKRVKLAEATKFHKEIQGSEVEDLLLLRRASTIKCRPQQDPVLGLRWLKSSEQHAHDKHPRVLRLRAAKRCVT
jgi:hypothetical protein